MGNICNQVQSGVSLLSARFFILLLLLSSSHMFLFHYEDELLAISTIIALFGMAYYRRAPSPVFIYMLGIIMLWIGYIVSQYDVWNIKTFVGFFCRFLMAYAVVVILKDKFFPVFVDVVYKLAIVSLILYLIGLLLPSLMQQLHFVLSSAPDVFIVDYGEYHGWIRDNFLVYTFSIDRLWQNHGFMWEPTAYASVLLFAMMIHLCLNQCQLDRRFKILAVVLVTTFSTTGIIASVFIVGFILVNGNRNNRIWLIYASVLILPFILGSDLVAGKISEELEHWGDVSTVDTDFRTSGSSRLSSFMLDIEDVQDHPLLGLGIFSENRYLGAQFLESNNGISDTLSRFGIVISLIFIINLIISFRRLTRSHNMKGYLFFLFLFIVLSWSERFVILPLFLAFQMYCYTIGMRCLPEKEGWEAKNVQLPINLSHK